MTFLEPQRKNPLTGVLCKSSQHALGLLIRKAKEKPAFTQGLQDDTNSAATVVTSRTTNNELHLDICLRTLSKILCLKRSRSKIWIRKKKLYELILLNFTFKFQQQNGLKHADKITLISSQSTYQSLSEAPLQLWTMENGLRRGMGQN